MTGEDHWNALLRQVVDGRPVIVAMDVLVAAAGTAAQMADLGVEERLLLAGARGIGEITVDVEADALVVGSGARVGTIMEGIRAWQRVLDDPPTTMRRRIEAFDPDGRAWVIGALFNTAETVLGRPVLGARPSSWLALEDKTTVDPLWDAAGVRRAPSRIVDLDDHAAVVAAARELDAGAGTCFVADNASGWHGGGEYLRWTGPAGDPTRAATELRPAARRVRVMPFLEGRPCSIHGWVFDDHVAALRPCEMVVWWDDEHRLVYGGVSTVWEPSDADREEMREIARGVGHHLRDLVGYRGSFSVDGVITDDGFLPTELNPRFGGGLGRVAAGIDLPIYLLHLATIQRPDLNWRPRDLEAAVLAAADASPVGRVMLPLPASASAGSWRLARQPDGTWMELDDPDADADARIEVGPSVHEGMLAMVHLPTLARDESAALVGADVAVQVARLAQTEVGRLDAAREPDRRHTHYGRGHA